MQAQIEIDETDAAEKMAVAIATAMWKRMGTRCKFTREEMILAAMRGLWEAKKKYDSLKGVKLKSFAKHRIRGAVLDWVRESSWSNTRRKKKRLTSKIVSIDDLREDGQQVKDMLTTEKKISYNEDLDLILAWGDLKYLRKGMGIKNRIILFLRVIEGMSFKEIGECFGTCESNISRIMNEITKEMKGTYEFSKIEGVGFQPQGRHDRAK